MDYQDAKVLIRQSTTRTGVYNALEEFGIDTSLPLIRQMRRNRDAMLHKNCEVIQVAQYRLIQIENGEI